MEESSENSFDERACRIQRRKCCWKFCYQIFNMQVRNARTFCEARVCECCGGVEVKSKPTCGSMASHIQIRQSPTSLYGCSLLCKQFYAFLTTENVQRCIVPPALNIGHDRRILLPEQSMRSRGLSPGFAIEASPEQFCTRIHVSNIRIPTSLNITDVSMCCFMTMFSVHGPCSLWVG